MNTCPCCGKTHPVVLEGEYIPSELPIMISGPNQDAQLMIEQLNKLQYAPLPQIFVFLPYSERVDRGFVDRGFVEHMTKIATVTTEVLQLVELEAAKRRNRTENEKEARKRYDFTARTRSMNFPRNNKNSRCRQWW